MKSWIERGMKNEKLRRYHTFALEFWTKNRLFLRPQLSLKSKTNTNQQRIGYLPWKYPSKWTVPLLSTQLNMYPTCPSSLGLYVMEYYCICSLLKGWWI